MAVEQQGRAAGRARALGQDDRGQIVDVDNLGLPAGCLKQRHGVDRALADLIQQPGAARLSHVSAQVLDEPLRLGVDVLEDRSEGLSPRLLDRHPALSAPSFPAEPLASLGGRRSACQPATDAAPFDLAESYSPRQSLTFCREGLLQLAVYCPTILSEQKVRP
jgi:hypothetical protein